MPVIIKQSYTYRAILWLAALCTGLWRDSGLCALLNRLGDAGPHWLRGSLLFRAVHRDGVITRSWPDSLTARATGAVVNLPTAIVRRIYRPCRKVLESSLIWRILAWLGGHTAVLTGVFLMVLLSAPHDYWNNVYSFLAAVVLALLFILASARGEWKVELTRLGPWFTLFVLTVGIALFTSASTSLSIRFFLFYVAAFLFTLLIVSAVRRPEQLLHLLTAVAVGMLACGLFGCWQAYTGVEVVYSQQDPILSKGMPGRIYSFFDNPNNFAEVLVMLLPLVLALLVTTKNWRVRLLSLAALGTGVVSLGATLSRSSWLGFVLALFVFLAMINWKVVPFALIAGCLALPLLPSTIIKRLLTIGNSADTSTTYRFLIYDSTFDMMKDYWFRGTGLGTDAMVKVFEQYPLMKDGNHPLHTHNNYLQMWAELGIFGGVFHLGTVFGQCKQGIRAYYTAPANRTVKIILAAAVGAFCGILLVGLAEYTWYYPRNQILFWALFGIISACIKLLRLPEEKKPDETPVSL